MHFGKFEVKPIEAPEKSLSEWTVPDKLKAEIPQTPEGRLEDIKNKINQLAQEISAERSLLLPRNGGIWDGAIGNSKWIPAEDAVPGSRNGTNPEHKSWSQIKECYHFEGIPFSHGEANFSEVGKGSVEIEDFSDDRGANFDQADEALALQRGCAPEEVAQWRKENHYTWHECNDCKTMQKVPSEVHGNIPHSGGISVYKAANLQDGGTI